MATRRGPDNTVRVAISGVRGTPAWANVFWCSLSTGGTIVQADLDSWTNSFQAAYKTNFAPVQGNSVHYSQAMATLFQPGGAVLHSVVSMTGAGTEAGAELPENAAAKVVSWLSSVYWRGGKPRTYLSGLVEADIVSSVGLTATAITNLKTAAAGFRTAVNALSTGTISGTALGFVSFRSGNADRVPPVFFPFTGSTAHTRLGTQRRRLGPWTP